MAIENNLPIIFDTATQTEDGLMSYQDKIKLDEIDQELTNKLSKTDKISSSQLDTSSDAVKIQPEHLSDAVKQMMTGQASVEATVPNNGVTTEKLATNAVTVDKIDKRLLLGNVVSPRPLNFAFDSKKVTINIPQGSLLLTDATTNRILVTGSDIQDVTVNINYPTDFDGLNYIVSSPTGSLSMINHRKQSTIGNTDTVMALVSLSSTYEATIVMNGNYNINGLAQGIGTESAALLADGKIVFDKSTGIIDFTDTTYLVLMIGGVYNRTILDQASIRLGNYAIDSVYSLYWDNATSSLKTALATIDNTDTDINKIAMIHDGRIIPFVDTGIFYSKPYVNAPYYTETFEYIDNVGLISPTPINILTEGEAKIEIPEETYVFVNEQKILVDNTECYYDDREGLHYILFDLDYNTLSCKYENEEQITRQAIPMNVNNIVIGAMWIATDKFPQVSGNFQYTVNGKTVYQDDLSENANSIKELKDIIGSNLEDNKILVSDELYMISDEELPIYSSSMLIKDTEGVKPAISYNKKGNTLAPRTEFFESNILIDPSNLGTDIKLLAFDKYNSKSYLSKDVKINKVDSTHKQGQTVKVLCLGDDLINDKTAYYLKSKLDTLGLTVNMLGTMINSQVYGEGRNGWFYSTFVGASGRGLKEGKITPQTSKAESSIFLNPFVRVANADDKANKPNDCYRSTGAYIEKNYYNDSDTSGAFYIFDFAKYIEVQGIETPDVVVLAIKPELAKVFTEDIVSTNMMYLKQIVSGIRAALPDTTIALIPQYGSCTVFDDLWVTTSKMIEETMKYVATLNDDKIKVLSSWLHMGREFGSVYNNTNNNNTQLYIKQIHDVANTKLSENAKIELANSIAAFIMNI